MRDFYYSDDPYNQFQENIKYKLIEQTKPWHSPFDNPETIEQQEKIADIFIKQCCSEKLKLIEEFSAAYLKRTNIDPTEAVLVEEQIDNVITWRFEPKSKFNFKEEKR